MRGVSKIDSAPKIHERKKTMPKNIFQKSLNGRKHCLRHGGGYTARPILTVPPSVAKQPKPQNTVPPPSLLPINSHTKERFHDSCWVGLSTRWGWVGPP